ncbi:MAG: DUF6647 family protein [Xanthobacteraceae bacterium]
MRKLMQAAALITVVAAPTAAAAQSSPPPGRTNPVIVEQLSDRASDALLTSIVTWLSTNFDLQPTMLLPKVKLASAAAMTQRRYRTFLGTDGSSVSPSEAALTTVAIYDQRETTIYLPLDWTGQTPAELSVLVHEMVHHLQNVAQTKFECPQAREQLAYAAQQRWLNLFGHTLQDEFQIDPFTLLVTTRCMH